MLPTNDDSLHTLRVASPDGHGLTYYQAITSRTSLTPTSGAIETTTATATSTTTTGHFKQQRSKSATTLSLKTSNTQVAFDHTENPVHNSYSNKTKLHRSHSTEEETNDWPEPRQADDEDSSLQHPAAMSTQANNDGKLFYRTYRTWNPNKIAQRPFYSNVASKETVERPDMTALPARSGALFPSPAPNYHRRMRPKVLVLPRHSCPEGLNDTDAVHGLRIRIDAFPPGRQSSSRRQKRHREHVASRLEELDKTRPTEQAHDAKKMNPNVVFQTRMDPEESSVLELNVTPIRPEMSKKMPSPDNDNGNGNQYSLHPNSSGGNNVKDGESHPSFLFQSVDFNTLQGIRQSYRRAQSAPPAHTRSKGGNCPQSGRPQFSHNTTDETKKFSTLYWRAKSAYHKSHEENACEKDPSGSSVPKHTLLRPLLRAKGESPHSATRPCTATGCFKACLVSNTYLQNAIAKAIHHSKDDLHKPDNYRHKSVKPAAVFRVSKTDLVKQALRKCQPLFQSVYGIEKPVGGRKVQPWPEPT